MRYQEIRKLAERIAKERHVPIDSIEIEVSVCPNDSNAEDGIRYFGTPHEAMENQGGIMICSDGERNISRKDDAENLRSSVRRLVGEWETFSRDPMIHFQRKACFEQCAKELSALIDTPETPPQTEGRVG